MNILESETLKLSYPKMSMLKSSRKELVAELRIRANFFLKFALILADEVFDLLQQRSFIHSSRITPYNFSFLKNDKGRNRLYSIV